MSNFTFPRKEYFLNIYRKREEASNSKNHLAKSDELHFDRSHKPITSILYLTDSSHLCIVRLLALALADYSCYDYNSMFELRIYS